MYACLRLRLCDAAKELLRVNGCVCVCVRAAAVRESTVQGSSWRWVISLATAGVPLTPWPSLLLLSVSSGAVWLIQTCSRACILPLLMPISLSLCPFISKTTRAMAHPAGLFNWIFSECPVSYSSSLHFMIHKGQPSKGSLSSLPLNRVFFLPSWLFFPSCPFFFLPFVCAFFSPYFWLCLLSSDSMKPKATERCGCRCLRSVGERDSNWGKQMALASGVQPEEQVRVTWPPVTRAIWLLLACEWKERGGPQSERAQKPPGHCVICGREKARLWTGSGVN